MRAITAIVDVVKVLLDKGADLTIKDTFYGFTPLMLAVSPAQKKRPEHTEIAKLLIAKGAPGKDDALSGAIESDDAALVKFILDSGGIPAPKLSEALEVAKSQKQDRDGFDAGEGGREAYRKNSRLTPRSSSDSQAGTRTPGATSSSWLSAGARLALGPAAAPPDAASRARGEGRDDVPRHRDGWDVNRIQDRGGQGHRLHAHAASGKPGRLHADGGKVMMRRNLLTAFALSRSGSLAVGAALAGVPRRERRRRRRRHADGGQVERGDRRERRVEDAGARRRRFEPDRLGRPRVRVDRGQQRSEPGHSDRAVRRRRAGERLLEALVAADRARQEVRQGPLGQGRLRRHSEDQAPSEVQPGVRDAGDRRTPRHRLVRIARGCTPTTSTASCSGRRTSAC